MLGQDLFFKQLTYVNYFININKYTDIQLGGVFYKINIVNMPIILN